MKEILFAIVTALFPAEAYSDKVGYCYCEYTSVSRSGGLYELHHRHQGRWYCSEGAYAFFSTASFQRDPERPRGGPEHTTCIRKWKYSWLDRPYVVLEPVGKGRSREGCWKPHPRD